MRKRLASEATMTRQWWIRICAVLAGALLIVSGGYASGGNSMDAIGRPAAAAPTETMQEDMEGDINTAVYGVDTYWEAHWSDFFTLTYSSPTVLGAYDGAEADAPECNGEPLADDNAFYCPGEDYIAWDIDLMQAGYRNGDAFVYFVIAHEWGHAIQNRLDVGLVTVDAELQADCLAGAALTGAAEDETIIFETGDSEELAQALTSLADDTPWTKAGDHGSADQRIDAFVKGQEEGVQGCLPEQVID